MDKPGLPIDDSQLPVTGGAADAARDLLPRVLDSVSCAVQRMRRSQHSDGGWGLQVEQSNFWHTAYAVLFLRAVRNLPEQDGMGETGEMLASAIAHLERHSECWAADMLSVFPGISIYETGVMARCFYRVGRAYVRRESALRIYRSIDRLYHSQNNDGGWDAKLWGYEVKTPIYVWSEVGATSVVLQALAETREQRFEAVVNRGMQWLAAVQNPDGSWNNGSCGPDLAAFQLSGQPAVNKTCDALQGILAGQGLEIPLQPFRKCMELGAAWLRSQAKPILDRQHQSDGCEGGYGPADYENTCLTLETLLRLPGTPLADLSSFAAWLLNSQRRQPGDAEDGAWVLGHTARIGLALTQFYLRASGEAADPQVPWTS
jgi:squalene cyclase